MTKTNSVTYGIGTVTFVSEKTIPVSNNNSSCQSMQQTNSTFQFQDIGRTSSANSLKINFHISISKHGDDESCEMITKN